MSDNMILELNSVRRDSEFGDGNIKPTSAVVEVFSAIAKGENLNRFGAKADKAVNYIKKLGERAMSGDGAAVSELNAIRRFTIEPLLMDVCLLFQERDQRGRFYGSPLFCVHI